MVVRKYFNLCWSKSKEWYWFIALIGSSSWMSMNIFSQVYCTHVFLLPYSFILLSFQISRKLALSPKFMMYLLALSTIILTTKKFNFVWGNVFILSLMTSELYIMLRKISPLYDCDSHLLLVFLTISSSHLSLWSIWIMLL